LLFNLIGFFLFCYSDISFFYYPPIRILRAPVRAPRANSIAERWIGTVRRELLDRMLILNRALTFAEKTLVP